MRKIVGFTRRLPEKLKIYADGTRKLARFSEVVGEKVEFFLVFY